jgi:hypothetical protein
MHMTRLNYFPNYYQAVAALKSHCFYDNVLTFSVDGGTLKYKLDNGGSTFNASLKCWWWNRK